MTVDDPDVLADFTSAFERYELALMANDVTALDNLFRNSASTVRYGVGENLYGYDEIARFRAERPGGSPQRRIIRRSLSCYGAQFATAHVEFQRDGSTQIGRQTQAWIKSEDGWQVVSAHVSMMVDHH